MAGAAVARLAGGKAEQVEEAAFGRSEEIEGGIFAGPTEGGGRVELVPFHEVAALEGSAGGGVADRGEKRETFGGVGKIDVGGRVVRPREGVESGLSLHGRRVAFGPGEIAGGVAGDPGGAALFQGEKLRPVFERARGFGAVLRGCEPGAGLAIIDVRTFRDLREEPRGGGVGRGDGPRAGDGGGRGATKFLGREGLPAGERGGGVVPGEGADVGGLGGRSGGEGAALGTIEPGERGIGIAFAPLGEQFGEFLFARRACGKVRGEGESLRRGAVACFMDGVVQHLGAEGCVGQAVEPGEGGGGVAGHPGAKQGGKFLSPEAAGGAVAEQRGEAVEVGRRLLSVENAHDPRSETGLLVGAAEALGVEPGEGGGGVAGGPAGERAGEAPLALIGTEKNLGAEGGEGGGGVVFEPGEKDRGAYGVEEGEIAGAGEREGAIGVGESEAREEIAADFEAEFCVGEGGGPIVGVGEIGAGPSEGGCGGEMRQLGGVERGAGLRRGGPAGGGGGVNIDPCGDGDEAESAFAQAEAAGGGGDELGDAVGGEGGEKGAEALGALGEVGFGSVDGERRKRKVAGEGGVGFGGGKEADV